MIASVNAPRAISVGIAPTAEQASARAGQVAAEVLRQALAQRGQARVVFASAPSQKAKIATLGGAEGIDWSKVASMHLDDYLGLDPHHPAAFGQWLADRLPEQAQPGLDRIRTDGETAAEIERYTQVVTDGPIDLVCLGIGVNGHLAFNEPGDTDFNDLATVREIALARMSRQQQVDEGLFATLDEVPTHALTLTVPAIMRGCVIVGTVLGASKAASVAAALIGPITPQLPASALRTHANVHLFLDDGAASALPQGFPAQRGEANTEGAVMKVHNTRPNPSNRPLASLPLQRAGHTGPMPHGNRTPGLGNRTPGLIDLQVNGYAGHDVHADDVTPQTVIDLTRALWAEGVTSYLPTVITASVEKVEHCLAQIAAARSADDLIAHSIPGVHVEGPHLAPDDGPRGAHDVACLRDPDLAELDRWQQAAQGLVRIVTLAPERIGSLDYIAGAVERGVLISLGHSAAESEHIHDAARAGATLSTHLGNGTFPVLPRHPNHIWAQLAQDRLTAMVIPDGHHLPADTLTVMIRAKGIEHTVLTSDSVALAGVASGEYQKPSGVSVTVHDDGRITLPGTHLLAGSGYSLRHGIAWARQHLPFERADVLRMATVNPAEILGLPERVTGGADTVEWDGDEVAVTRVAGVEVYRA